MKKDAAANQAHIEQVPTQAESSKRIRHASDAFTDRLEALRKEQAALVREYAAQLEKQGMARPADDVQK